MAQPSPPPDWPIDYPYVALQNYQDENVSMPAGTRGKVISRERPGGWVWVTMPYFKPPKSGWVPRNLVNIGTARKYGDLRVHVQLPTLSFQTQLAASAANFGRFRLAMTAFLHELRVNSDQLSFLPPWFRDDLKHDASFNGLINGIMTGMRLPVLELLNNGGDFTINDLAGRLKHVSSNDTRQGVYTRIYRNFKSAPGRKPSQYIGKSNNLGSRLQGHVYSAGRERNSNHYKTMRDAGDMIMGALCYLDSEKLRTVAEQVFTSLFETYCDAVMTFNEGVTQEAAASDQQNEKAAKYLTDKEASILLQQLARASFAKSRWPGGRIRPSYGASDACNWNSPITEWIKGERIVWTEQSFPEANLIVYRRTPVQIRSGTANMKRIFIVMEAQEPNRPRGSFEPTIPFNVENLPVGTWVYPVVEMTADDSIHPLSYTRLPDKGPYNDWDAASSWALKIEIERDNGTWQHLYLSCRNPYEPRTAQLNWRGAFNVYGHGIAIRRYLKQLQLDTYGRQAWMYDYGVATVKRFGLDFLTQTINVQDALAPNIIVRASQIKKVFDMRYELSQVGLNAFGNVPGQLDRPSSLIRRNPGACDSCYLHNLDSRSFANGRYMDHYPGNLVRFRCVRQQGTDPNQAPVCTRCFQLARPCTYTRAIEECPLSDPRVRALRPRPVGVRELESIPDPEVSVHGTLSAFTG